MREIDKKLVTFIDKRLAGNGLAREALGRNDPRTLFRLAAQACVGIREEGGDNRGPLVSLIQDTVGGPDPLAWCMSFVQTCLAYSEHKTEVKSPIVASEHCLTVWEKTPKIQRVKVMPLPGAIAVWKFTGTQSGHTGIVDGCDDKIFTAFEGNTEGGTSPTGEVVREGGGVYFTKRSRAGTAKMALLGFLKPF